MGMRNLVITLLTSAALMGAAEAAQVNFQGDLVITGKAGTCPGDPTGGHFFARYRPNIAGNPDNVGTKLTLFSPGFGLGFRLNTGNFNVGPSSAFKAVSDWVSLGGNFGAFGPVPRIRYLSHAATPAGPVTANTQFINIVGQIQNFDEAAGCTITFRLPLTARP
jgi:hypothetical protein